MSDNEIALACAEAVGLKPYRAVPGGFVQNCSSSGIYVVDAYDPRGYTEYDPFRDDAQAMALVKKAKLSIAEPRAECGWGVYRHDALRQQTSEGYDLNRCICLCVAQMQLAKGDETHEERRVGV